MHSFCSKILPGLSYSCQSISYSASSAIRKNADVDLMHFKNIKIYHKDVPINQQLNELKKVNKNIFYLLTVLQGYLPMETEQ